MNIVFLASTRLPTERAMGTAIMRQCEGFAEKGCEVTLVVPKRRGSLEADPLSYYHIEHPFTLKRVWCLEIPYLGPLGLLIRQVTFLFSLLFVLRSLPPDTILYSREPALLASIPTKKKKYVELHHLYGLTYLGRLFVKRFHGIITITEALKEDVIRKFSYPSARILVAPSGVQLKEFLNPETREVARRRLGIESRARVALYIGEFDVWKGVGTFLEASSLLRSEGVLPVVIGGSPHEVQLRKGKYPHVLFLGRRPQSELPHNQQIADVLVVPNSARYPISARHTSPLKVFTHMTSGIPIVASNLLSLREVLSTENAFLFEADSPNDLKEKILTALTEEIQSKMLAQNARMKVEEYDWSKRSTRIVEYIHESARDTHE